MVNGRRRGISCFTLRLSSGFRDYHVESYGSRTGWCS
jgi:hypothetical protein